MSGSECCRPQGAQHQVLLRQRVLASLWTVLGQLKENGACPNEVSPFHSIAPLVKNQSPYLCVWKIRIIHYWPCLESAAFQCWTRLKGEQRTRSWYEMTPLYRWGIRGWDGMWWSQIQAKEVWRGPCSFIDYALLLPQFYHTQSLFCSPTLYCDIPQMCLHRKTYSSSVCTECPVQHIQWFVDGQGPPVLGVSEAGPILQFVG